MNLADTGNAAFPAPGGDSPGTASRRTLIRRGLKLGAGVALLGTGLAAGCAPRDQRLLLSADTHPDGYPTVEAVRAMGDTLNRETDGRLRIKIYSGGQLGAESDTLEITIFGGLDLNRVNLAPLNTFAPMTVIPALPFLFRSTEHMRRAMDGAPGEAILNSLEAHGLIGLCFYDSGERSFYNTRRPIRTPADMRGLKIRVQGSDLYVSMIRALGADATPMPLGEVYQSLVQGVVDGAENNWPSYHSGRHFEAARYYSLTRHVMAPEVLVMSASRWAKLSAEDREHVRRAAKASVPVMRQKWDARVEASRSALLAAGVEVNEVDDTQAFAAAMRPVWDRFVTTQSQRAILADIIAMEEA